VELFLQGFVILDFVSSKDYPNGIDYVRQGKNLIVLRTFSKIYGLGGCA
jgi:histidinol-phosphate aminotransferase